MLVLKHFTIRKYLNITMIGSSWNSYTTRQPKLSLTTFMHWLFQQCQLISNNLLKSMGMVLYLPIMKLRIFFIFYHLLISHIHSKIMWNQMEINYHLVTFFANSVYTSPGRHKSRFMSRLVKDEKLWLCQWTQLLFQILAYMFLPIKVSSHKRISYVP